MKVKKIGALCKSEGCCYLYDELTEDGEIRRQWISCGTAMWPVSGLPMLRESNLSTLFDFSPNQTEKMRIKEEAMPENLYGILYDGRDGESVLQESFIRVRANGTELMALTVGAKTIWLDADMLRPCWTKETRLVRREAENREYIAVMDGLFLSGIILPVVMMPETYRELLRLGVSSPKPVVPQEPADNDEDGV